MRELRSRIGQVYQSVVEANGTELYYEVRGNGSPVLFISGATGDAGHFAHVADALADDFRVITYDRRGNSRSPRPKGWTQTGITEQADDAAALLEALAVSSAVVFGTSGGGTILMDLIRRHSGVLKGALVHEPVLMSGSPSAAEVGALLQGMIKEAANDGRQPRKSGSSDGPARTRSSRQWITIFASECSTTPKCSSASSS